MKHNINAPLYTETEINQAIIKDLERRTVYSANARIQTPPSIRPLTDKGWLVANWFATVVLIGVLAAVCFKII